MIMRANFCDGSAEGVGWVEVPGSGARIGAPCVVVQVDCRPGQTRGSAPTELREHRGMLGDDADEAATGCAGHAFGGRDGVSGVGDGGVVYLDCALLGRALGLFAVGGAAGVDGEVADAVPRPSSFA